MIYEKKKIYEEMTHKERILAAIEHRPIDRIPIDYWGTPETTNKLIKELNLTKFTELINILDLDKIISIRPEYIGPKINNGIKIVNSVYRTNLKDEFLYDYWGVKYKIAKHGRNGSYYEICSHPIQRYETVAEIEENYKWPKTEWFNFRKMSEEFSNFHNYAIEGGYMAPFYMYNNIRGLAESLIDLASNEKLAYYIIEKICDFLYEYAKKIFEIANGKVDIAQVTDDFGTQEGLMISVDMFNKYFREQYIRLIKLVKSYNIKVFHHDDGSIMKLIPTLVELGIDILNPIQWHLPGMDLDKLKKNYGDKICFHGAIDNQYILPFGTTADVEKEVINCIDILASDKTGYILAPCHNIQINTPVENVLKMYDTARKYGKF